MSAAKKGDRRSLRSQEQLHRALMELMSEKRYDRITVQDIIDRANVGRSTFYAHYQDKEDLLVSNFEHMLQSISTHWSTNSQGPTIRGDHIMSITALFQHTQEYHGLYEALVWGRGIELIHQQAQTFFAKRIGEMLQTMVPIGSTPQVPLPMLANHIAATLGSLLRWWLEEGMPYTPEEMDTYFHQLVVPVIEQALGELE